MTYNVFGGTLNPAQLNCVSFSILTLMIERQEGLSSHKTPVTSIPRGTLLEEIDKEEMRRNWMEKWLLDGSSSFSSE